MPHTQVDNSDLKAKLRAWMKGAGLGEPLLTDLAAIVPAGSRFAYAVDEHGQLTGLKFARADRSISNEFFEWLYAQSSIERLVLSGSGETLPTGVKRLTKLKFLRIEGFARVPSEYFSIGLALQIEHSRARGDSHHFHAVYRAAKELVGGSQFNEKNAESSRSVLARGPRGRENQVEAAVAKELQQRPDFRKAILDDLTGLLIEGSIADPPLEIIARGQKALETYFRAQDAATEELNEMKLLMVGHGGAGKTSILRLLSGEKFNPEEKQTHGINIRSIEAETSGGRHVTMKTWDFGGQEIMHATHQFFLSKRSVYLIVLDGRKDEQAEYWLRHVQSFGGDAPTVVVLNKYDEHSGFDVNRRFLQQKYPGIIAFVRTSCATGHGILELKAALEAALDGVELLRTRWPGAWLRVKERLEQTTDPFLTKQAYERFCKESGIAQARSQETLAQFLNDLGVIVHFADFKLADTHVLSPHWLTGAVYRLLTAPLLAASGGIMSLDDVSQCLEHGDAAIDDYPKECHGFIIEIMRKFELCYYVEQDSILVPDLLPVDEPSFAFPSVV